MSMINKNKAVN